MNAKKIMGAVLVALLAAALFVGAGAAATTNLFYYQDYTKAGVNAGIYSGEGGTFTLGSGVTYLTPAYPVGKYVNTSDEDDVIMLSKPTLAVTGQLLKDKTSGTVVAASINGATLPSGKNTVVEFNVSNTSAAGLIFTAPNGVKSSFFGGIDFANSSAFTSAINVTFENVAQGEWKVQALFYPNNYLVNGTPFDYLIGAEALTFTVAPADFSIDAAADEITVGDVVAITIVGVPGNVTVDFGSAFTVPKGQPNVGIPTTDGKVTVAIPNTGSLTFYLKAAEDGSQTILATHDVTNKDAKVTIKVGEGQLTIEAEKESYFLGQDVVLSGINNGGSLLYFYIEGTNFAFKPFNIDEEINGDNWEAEVDGSEFTDLKIDAGTYTIFVSTDEVKEKKDLDNYASASVALKQPFLSADAESNIVAMGATLKINGIAESTANVTYYVFGTNYFATGVRTVDSSDSTFIIKLDTQKLGMDAGQYFVVVQHPMYDKVYEIAPFATAVANASITNPDEDEKKQIAANISAYVEKNGYNIVLNSSGKAIGNVAGATYNEFINKTSVEYPNEILFNTKERQSSNAAEALCQALDDQNIDDIYVKLSFIVASPMATMNPVASEVVKGEKLTVSGTSNYPAGEMVTVQMASTAFGAIPKESVNTASFITLSTKVQEDGTWEVTFDTTGLNVDEYTIQATVGEFQNTAKVNLVEGAPVTPEQPDTPVTPEQPEQPTEPEAPATPGFGALAALAGLGAVAVLLLRRE